MDGGRCHYRRMVVVGNGTRRTIFITAITIGRIRRYYLFISIMGLAHRCNRNGVTFAVFFDGIVDRRDTDRRAATTAANRHTVLCGIVATACRVASARVIAQVHGDRLTRSHGDRIAVFIHQLYRMTKGTSFCCSIVMIQPYIESILGTQRILRRIAGVGIVRTARILDRARRTVMVRIDRQVLERGVGTVDRSDGNRIALVSLFKVIIHDRIVEAIAIGSVPGNRHTRRLSVGGEIRRIGRIVAIRQRHRDRLAGCQIDRVSAIVDQFDLMRQRTVGLLDDRIVGDEL